MSCSGLPLHILLTTVFYMASPSIPPHPLSVMQVSKLQDKQGGVVYLCILSWPCMPWRVIGIDSHTYIIGQCYYCGDLQCGKSYRSWSQAILNTIPPFLASQFPFHLTFRSSLIDQLAVLVRSSFGHGLGPTPFVEMI